MNAIERKRQRILTKIAEWEQKLSTLQQECQHKNVDAKYHRDTGNYDSSMNRSWIDWRCNDCDKRWETPQ